MAINNITQTISTIPEAAHRGIDVQTLFVTKQEDFQDHLQGTTVTELNTLKDQLNTRISEINSTATTMNGYADTASVGASTATTKAGEASTSASEALTSRNQAETFKNNASASATKASQWAENNYNAAVETGKYSAKHWATVAETIVVDTVKLTGNQTIAGVKTFSSPISGNFIGSIQFNGSTGNVYYNSNITVNGNGLTNTIKPSIGFHQPELYAGTLSMLDGNTFQLQTQSGQPATLSNNITGNAGSAAAFTTAVGSAPSYACRAWVSFNGAGTVAIRASGNVSSITDNGVGDYIINFTTAMQDANYSSVGLGGVDNYAHLYIKNAPTTTSLNIMVGVTNAIAPMDIIFANIAIFR